MAQPSITYWSRLEPRPRGDAIARPLAAPVRDALWFLTRQWQIGEFQGEDAGSPAFAQITTRQSQLTGWRTGNGPFEPLPPGTPLEMLVEREPFTPDLSLQVELAQTFEALNGAKAPPSFLAKYPLEAPDAADAETIRFLSVCEGRSFNGIALYADIKANPASFPAPVFAEFVKWAEEVFGAFGLEDPPAWDPQKLEYSVEIEGTLPNGATAIFSAEPAQDAGFDWHTFDLIRTQAQPGQAAPQSTRSVIPTHVRFRGMPNARWWDFENNITDFGGVQPGKRDFAKLAAMDFMLLHGNDWFLIPFDLPVNSLSTIDLLLVRDVFGGTTLVRRAEDTDGPAGRWTMFSTSEQGRDQPADFFLLPSTAAVAIQQGALIEDVRWIRDPMANMAWAIERQTEGGVGQPRIGNERDVAGLKMLPPPTGSVPLLYQIETRVPLNWIPFLPVSVNPIKVEIALQLGAMLPPDIDPKPVRPVGRILHSTNLQPPTEPYTLREEEVSRAGVQVSRVLARARWLDGSTHLWIARRKAGGQGEGSSGLKFDLALPVEVDTTSIPPKEFETMPFLISITGAQQGAFKGESLRQDQAGKTVGLGFSYEVKNPRDPLTAQPTGKRQHLPITIIKAVGISSPQIFQAWATNERLNTVLFEFFKTNAQGADAVVYTVKLTNAAVSNIQQKLDASNQPGQPLDGIEYEAVSFVFEKIEVNSVLGQTSAEDSLAG